VHIKTLKCTPFRYAANLIIIIFHIIKINSIVLLFFQVYVEKYTSPVNSFQLFEHLIYHSIHLPKQSHQTKSQEFPEHFHSFTDIIFQFKFRLWVIIFYIKINSIVLLFFQVYVEKYTSPVNSFQLFERQ
jgi:hypothetical protein